MEVALGLIIATSFTKVANSLKFLVMKKGPKYYQKPGYNTREQALADGAVIWTYGSFLDELLAFFGLGLALYFIALTYGKVTKESVIRYTTKCAYCRKEISQKALRCPMCTSWLDGREDKETTAIPRDNSD
ncbi:hypothetical protein FA13DRAFT_1726850 [Coprinellus micaceus]|uniref:Gated mechanosensitive channel n=1 Tax=Coprinellus micaceus TaxID=71717 RepID=A0A4Y7TQP2_COPMI|nr:hypothetical protein FA13DRAFT_1726850 [Coprinellus micaceus]